MKLPAPKLGIPLTVATLLYILFSLFGCLFYLQLPPVVCSIGARVHAYYLISAAVAPDAAIGQTILMVVSQLYVFVMLVLAIVAIITGRARVFCIMAALEIGFSFMIIMMQYGGIDKYTVGILLNLAYCIWLFRKAFRKKPAHTTRISK